MKLDFFRHKEGIIDSEVNSSVNVPSPSGYFPNIEYKVRQLLIDDINQSIMKDLSKRLLTTPNKEYFLFTNDKLSSMDKLVNRIRSFGEKNIITNGNTGSMLQDYKGYSMTPFGGVVQSGMMYKSGKFMDKDLYIDPYMQWGDNKIILFDDIGLELSKDHYDKTVVDNTITCEYGFDIPKDPHIICVMEDENSDMYKEYKIEKRHETIDKILNQK